MDTFGRLPNEVLSQIVSLHALPSIKIVKMNDDNIYFLINVVSCCFKIWVTTPLYYKYNSISCEKSSLNELKEFIEIKTNIYTHEYKKEFFTVEVNNIITISTHNMECTLPLQCLDILMDAMKEYYDMLAKYPSH